MKIRRKTPVNRQIPRRVGTVSSYIRTGNAKDLKSLLDIAIINSQEAGQHYELGDG